MTTFTTINDVYAYVRDLQPGLMVEAGQEPDDAFVLAEVQVRDACHEHLLDRDSVTGPGQIDFVVVLVERLAELRTSSVLTAEASVQPAVEEPSGDVVFLGQPMSRVRVRGRLREVKTGTPFVTPDDAIE